MVIVIKLAFIKKKEKPYPHCTRMGLERSIDLIGEQFKNYTKQMRLGMAHEK